MGTSYNYDGGGGSWHTADGLSGTWTGQTAYWEVGAALGIGLGLWGTGDHQWGITWNVGIGAYAITGVADDATAAIHTVTQESIGIYADIEGASIDVRINPQTGVVTVPEQGFRFGFFGSSPDHY